jgi:hypothetical protein
MREEAQVLYSQSKGREIIQNTLTYKSQAVVGGFGPAWSLREAKAGGLGQLSRAGTAPVAKFNVKPFKQVRQEGLLSIL